MCKWWSNNSHSALQIHCKMHTVVSSSEIIKPMKATPHRLRKLSLSFLDQFESSGVVNHRLLLFYSANGEVRRFENTNMSYQLKKSLSVVLTEFYPLAGRFSSDDESIECNDSGVQYVEAQVRAPYVLDQLLSSPNAEELEQLYPRDTIGREPLLSVQVTIFDSCGGMVIGVCASRVIGDASALATFMKCWATASRGGKFESSNFGFTDVFPPGDLFGNIWDCDGDAKKPFPKVLTTAQKLVTKRFVFSCSKIAAITGCCVNPSRTRVQVVCAIIFKCLISVVRSRSSKSILLLRPRTRPPPNYVRNLPSSTAETAEAESSRGFVRLLRKTIRKFDSNYLKGMLGDEAILLMDNVQREMQDNMIYEAHYLEISSGCGLPYYEMDFGWGTPLWAAAFYAHVENLVTLQSSKNGGGIEAWVTLTEDDMTKFESAERAFLDYAHISARI